MLSRRLTALSTLLLLVPIACASEGSDESSAQPSVGESTTPLDTLSPESDVTVETVAADDADLAATVTLLRDGGVTVVDDDELEGATGDPFAITESQATNVALQVSIGGGVPGQVLRDRFPVPVDAVPVDALIAAWLTLDTPGADASREMVDTSTLTDPALFVFPWAVIDLFIQEVATDPSPIVAPSDEPEAEAQGFRGLSPTRPMGTADPCGSLQQFYADTIGATIAGLQNSDSVLGIIAGQALSLFVDVLGASVKAAIPTLVKTAVQALGVAAAVAGAIEPWSATLTPDPATTAKGISPAAGNPGTATLKVVTGTNDWPAPVKSCAALAGVDLPKLDPASAAVKWDMIAPDLADETDRDDVIAPQGDEYTATFDYATRVETVGPTSQDVSSIIVIDGQVTRNDRDTLVKLLGTMIGNALGPLPKEIALPLIGTAADGIAGLLEITDPVAPVAVIPITYHFTPEDPIGSTLPTLTVPASDPPDDDGCVGRVLSSQGVSGAADVLLRLNDDGTGIFDFGQSLPYNGATVRGVLTFTWTGGPEVFATEAGVGALLAAVEVGGLTQMIELPPDAIAEIAQPETLICNDGQITVQRTGEIYD